MSDDNNDPQANPAEPAPTAEQAPEATHTARTRRPRSRKAAGEPEEIGGAVDQVLQQAQQLAEGEIPNETKKPWQKRFGHRRDNEAGVRIEEDRRNNLATIIFRERPPEKALDALEKHGFEQDEEVGGFSKRLSKLRAHDSREQAENAYLEVVNIVRETKGLPKAESFFISRA